MPDVHRYYYIVTLVRKYGRMLKVKTQHMYCIKVHTTHRTSQKRYLIKIFERIITFSLNTYVCNQSILHHFTIRWFCLHKFYDCAPASVRYQSNFQTINRPSQSFLFVMFEISLKSIMVGILLDRKLEFP